MASFEQTRGQWRAAWSRKAGLEFSARLKDWQTYLHDLSDRAATKAGDFRHQARSRCILQLLVSEVDPPDTTRQAALAGLDSRLRAISAPGPFLWEPEVEKNFSPDSFWFLYISFP
jgi:hypothetical protein